MNSEPMNAPSPEAPASAPPPAVEPAPAPVAPRRGLQFNVLAAWLLAAVAIMVSVLLWQKVDGIQQQLARQSAEAGNNAVEARALARQAEETARETAARVAALEGKVSDMSAYRAQLEELVQIVTRARDENLATDLEAALRVAQDQTQLTGSVEPLLAALRTAERRLGRSTDPRLAPVARAVAKDLERVKAASLPDTAGLLARIDQLLHQADDLPLANDVGRVGFESAPRGSAGQPPESWWGRWWHLSLAEARDLLRVRRVERPEASMLSPEQAFFVRENLKLRLQGARLGLLARQYEAARADLTAAQMALGNWFDPASRRTQAAATLLQQIQGLTKTAELPRVQNTLAALSDAVTAADTPAGSR
ncbi:MAG: uroporphyrinogen-III C-methyltransferase [Desulfovibrionaceae bacterium]|jgi:uroporphyrin-3 C-methyltransferase|nr:uroporphyrinogen-III C-methyltransferase [Desulfovibrionaceae bacterium]